MSQKPRWRCSQCQTDAKFLCTLCHRIRDKGVQADGSYQQRNAREDADQNGCQAILCDGLRKIFFHGSHIGHRLIFVEAEDAGADGCDQKLRIAGTSYDEVHGLRRVLRQRIIHFGGHFNR